MIHEFKDGSLAEGVVLASEEARPTILGLRRFLSMAIGNLVFFALVASGFSKPELQGFNPRSIEMRNQTDVVAEGKFPEWPAEVWVNRAGLRFEFLEKGKLRITTTPEAIPGIYLVRLIDSKGASNIVPLIVDSLLSMPETEPNDTHATANSITAEAVNISGVLAKSGEVDCFRIDGKKGQVLFAGLRANPLFGTVMDGVLQICDNRGFVLKQNDDKLGIDPIVSLVLPEDATYQIRVFSFPAAPNSTVRFAGGSDYRYLLTISTKPLVRVVFPLSDKRPQSLFHTMGNGNVEKASADCRDLGDRQVVFVANDRAGFFELEKSADGAVATVESEGMGEGGLKLPFDFSGVISTGRELDWIPFQAEKGKAVRFQVEGRKFGLEIDPVAAVFDANGKQIVSKDDNSKTDPDLVLDFTPKENGVYYLQIKDAANAGGPDYFYRVRAEKVHPDFQLNLKSSAFEHEISKTGKPKALEIEVAIDRKDGFELPLEISIEGLPSDVEFEAVKSEPKGETAKSVKLKIVAKSAFQARCRIVTKLWDRTFYAEEQLGSGYRVKDIWITSVGAEMPSTEKK